MDPIQITLPISTHIELYDMIMSQIEPELTTTAMPGLVEKYKDESEAATQAREERYNKAFELFDHYIGLFAVGLEEEVRIQHRTALSTLEKRDREEEAHTLDSITSTIDHAA